MKIVLSLFDYSGNMVKPWAEAGYKCICVDWKHNGQKKEGNIIYYGTNLVGWLPPLADYKIVFAFPPCTHIAVSGARHFQRKGLGKLIEALQTFEAAVKICKWAKAPYMIENPVSVISSYYRKPDYKFNPFEYGGYLSPPGDAYYKMTCLWTGNGFIMPKPIPVSPIEGSKMHYYPPSELRSELRSITPNGFAKAVYEANKEVVG